jgi:hypothetical protein
MPDEDAANKAIEEWDQGSIDDQVIRVDVAKASIKDFKILQGVMRV